MYNTKLLLQHTRHDSVLYILYSHRKKIINHNNGLALKILNYASEDMLNCFHLHLQSLTSIRTELNTSLPSTL
jgi:hypothetical protein